MSAAFIAFARAHGVLIEPNRFDDSGKLRRCGTTDHPRSTNGAYVWDGRGGFVWAWDGEGRAIAFNDPEARPLTEAEQRRSDAKRQAVRDEQDHLQRKAAELAARMLTLAKPGEHGYLIRKGFRHAVGLVLPEGELFIPMRHLRTNELRGAQIVQWLPEELRWEKKFLYGMRSKGAVLRLGPRHAVELILCEGYATGLSIEAAVKQMRLNAAVMVCFSAHNLTVAAERTSGRRYVIADHDTSEAGQRAATATGLGWAMPEEVDTDANDLHVKHGLMAVCALVMRARSAVVDSQVVGAHTSGVETVP